MKRAGFADKLHNTIFTILYNRSLIYNACWEDPAVDRKALNIRPQDRMLVVTSAGCNVLDYALCGPARIDAVDANPRQTALLELKIAGIRRLYHDEFFDLFGKGKHPSADELYHDLLRQDLSDFSKQYWDRYIHWFSAKNGMGFYSHGLSGWVARMFQHYLKVHPQLKQGVEAVLSARQLEQQREQYDQQVAPYLWRPSVKWALSRSFTMSLLGVPYPQREEVRRYHNDGIAGFVREAVDYVFRNLPVWENYFWSVYIQGEYSRDCCPEYLKPDNFRALKNGLVDRIKPHTNWITSFLNNNDHSISRFVLLDHMDWMSSYHPQALIDEWEAILAHATMDAKIIFRSAHARPDYLLDLEIPSRQQRLSELLCFDRALAKRLQMEDRVHTYAGFHIANLD